MFATITIVTTANRQRTFVMNDRQAFDDLTVSLQRYQLLFRRKTLILASDRETEIFLPSSLTRIEIQSGEDIFRSLPGTAQDSVITAIDSDQPLPKQQQAADFFSGRVDFFFQGGDNLATWIDGPLASHQVERVANFNNVFDQGVITYIPRAGGIGFMNPEVMTRMLVNAGARVLPADAWRVAPEG